jgi:hypothetical protein
MELKLAYPKAFQAGEKESTDQDYEGAEQLPPEDAVGKMS